MTTLQRMAELAPLQAKFMPQIEIIQAVYRSMPPKTLFLLQKMSASPTYKTMAALPVHQLGNASDVAKMEQQTAVLMDGFFSVFERMTTNEQESVIDTVSSVEIPKAIFEKVLCEPPEPEKQSLHVDIPCSVYVLPKDVDSSWMQIRKAVYPIVHDRLAATIAMCAMLLNTYGSCDPTLKHLLTVLIVVSWIVDVAGDPSNPSNKDQ